MPEYEPSRRRLQWPNGTIATTYSAEEPDVFRGPQHHIVFCDELAAWKYLQESWDNISMGLRLGEHPRCIITTTPKPRKVLKEIMKAKTTIVTKGSTHDNLENLAASFKE